jgi:tetratricopeptide (TPR) repeat protein
MERTALMIAKLARLLAGFTLTPVVFCAAVSGQQALPIYGKVLRPGKTAVVGAEVRIEKGGATKTGNSGEFELPMPQSLRVGLASVFTVTHYVILSPCELQRGRTYLRDPSMDPIELLVLPMGDSRLKAANLLASAKADPVIRILLKCVIEEDQASEFAEKPKAGGKPRSSLPSEQQFYFPGQAEKSPIEAKLRPIPRVSRPYLISAAYYSPVSQSAPGQFPAKPQKSEDPSRDEFLAKKAKDLGLSVEELKLAMKAWDESAEDPYEKGLAALRELRYADASRYISASITSSQGDVLKKYVMLARAEREQAHYAAAEAALRKVLAVHKDDALVLNLLGLVLLDQANYSEAEPLLKRSLAINEKALGPDDPVVAINLNNLATLYDDQGRYAEAKPLYQRAMAIDEKVRGPEHPEVAIHLNNLAVLYFKQGKYAEAEPLLKRALAIDEKVLGPNHPGLAIDLNNLAELYRKQGKFTQAEPLYKRALAIDEKTLGPDHPSLARGLNNLAALYAEQDKYAEAEQLYKRALAIREKTIGPNHPSTADTLNNLALIYKKEGKYADAEQLYKRALTIDEKALGPDHPGLAIDLNNLATLYEKQGKYADAESLLKRSLVINEKALGPDHPEVATGLNNLATLYDDQGKYADAESLYRRALAIYEKALGPDHPSVATTAENLAVLLRKLGRDAEADAYVQQAAKIRAQKKP